MPRPMNPYPQSPVYENLFHRTAAVALDIIVVGGSIGGLAAAYNLVQAGHNVEVLEATDGTGPVSPLAQMFVVLCSLLI